MTKPRAFFGLQIPFLELIGAHAEQWERGRAVVSLELSRDLTNSWGSAHGGVLTSLLDVAMGAAAMSVDSHATGVVTASLSVTFLTSGAGGLVAEGRLMKGGRSLAFSEGEVRDRSGALVAKGVGTYKVKRRVAGGSNDPR
jgi:uncharacterized protein (TIGR00369 family)